jgi:CHC2 zinc finger
MASKLAKRGREYLGSCPRCGGCSRFSINPDKAVFLCRGCNAGGGGSLDLEIFLTGCSFAEAIEALTGERMPSADEARAAKAKRRVEEKAAQAGQLDTARWLWGQRRAPQGTLVEIYLRARGYTGIIPATIGYLPARGDYAPSMIAAYARPCEIDEALQAPPDAEVFAVHLTRILPDGSDRRRDDHAKITIGAPLGHPIALGPITDALSLVITEGIEDGLAFVAAGFAAWAAGSAVYLPALEPLIPHCLEVLVLERHPDEGAYRAIADLQRKLSAWDYPPDLIIREAAP